MKRKLIRSLVWPLLVMFLITGCGNIKLSDLAAQPVEREELDNAKGTDTIEEQSLPKEPVKESSDSEIYAAQETLEVQETEIEEETSSGKTVSQVSDEELQSAREAIGLGEDKIESLLKAQSRNYYFGQCSKAEQLTYVEIYQILTNDGKDVMISGKDVDSLTRVYQSVINDHPELFYLCGYTYTKHTVAGEVKYLTFSGRYLYTNSEIASRQAEIEGVVAAILAGVPTGADEYTKVKYIYEYLIFQTEYGATSADNQNICSVFIDHISVCNGYAKATQLLLNRLGIDCIIVNGLAGGGAHAWNIVKIDGMYYHLDTTWGDPSYYNEEAGSVTPDIDYSYLNVTSDDISKNHEIDRNFTVPQCTSMDANYFVRENLYFDALSEEKLTKVFSQAETSGQQIITIKAADAVVYQQLYAHLLDNQKIFQYYKAVGESGNYSVAYSSNDSLYTLSFWK